MASTSSNPNAAEKVRENRLRRMADRQGMRLVKSRRRDPRAIDYGGYMLVNPEINAVVAGTESIGRPSWSLDDVEQFLLHGFDAHGPDDARGGSDEL